MLAANRSEITDVLGRLSRVGARHPDIALRQLERLERERRDAGDVAGAIDALCQRFHELEHRGRALELRVALQQAASDAAAGGHNAQAARVAEAMGRMSYQQGNYLDASEQWSRALDLSDANGEVRVGVSALIGLGQIHYAMGAWNSGLRFHRDAATRVAKLDDTYLSAKLSLNIGVGHFETGQTEDAERNFMHGLAAARRGLHHEFEGEAHWHLARAALARGQLQRAIADCRLALDIAGTLHHAWLEAAAGRTWTEIAIARGDEEGAIRSTLHGLALARRIESKPQQSQAHLQLARLLERKGDFQAALQHLWQHVALQGEIESAVLRGRAAPFSDEINANSAPTGDALGAPRVPFQKTSIAASSANAASDSSRVRSATATGRPTDYESEPAFLAGFVYPLAESHADGNTSV